MEKVLSLIVSVPKGIVLYHVAKLGIADLLKDGPKTGVEIATQTNTLPEYMSRLLQTAALMGVFDVNTADNTYSLNEVSKELLDDPFSMKWHSFFYTNMAVIKSLLSFDQTLKNGTNAYEAANGVPFYQHMAQSPDLAESFNKYMHAKHKLENTPTLLLEKYSFAEVKHVVDIGGNAGTLLWALLSKYPHLKGTNFDQPHVIANVTANRRSDLGETASRIKFIGGDFFAGVPSGGDLYILQRVILDWSDEKAIKLLTIIRNELPENGKVLVIDDVNDEPSDLNNDLLGFYLITLLGITQERTQEDYRKLFEAAGLKLTQTIQLEVGICAFEGQKL